VDTLNVLIVEDNPDHRFLLRRKLESHYKSISVHAADSVPEAMELMESTRYRTVLLDYRLKGRNGIDLVKWIKERGIDTPVIMITSMEDVEVAVQAIKLGVYDYVCKNKESLDKLPFVLGKVLEEFDLKQRLKQAELKYHTLIDGMDEAVFMMDRDLRMVYVSRSVERLFGYSGDEFARMYSSFFMDGDLALFRRNIASVFEEGNLEPFVVRICRRDGSYGHIEINCILYTEEDTACVLGTLQDVSRRVELQQEVESERQKISDIFNSIVDWIYIVDHNYTITFMNKSLKKQLGGVHQGKCYELLYGSRVPCSFCKLPNIASGKTVRWELRREDGKTFDIISSPLANPDGKSGKLEILRDITRRKEAEEKYLNQLDETVRANNELKRTIEQLKRMQEQLVQSEKLAAIGGLVSGVAHELNNPLFSAMGNTELLLMNDSDPEERRKKLNAVLESLERARVIVNDLLQFAHREKVQKAAVSLAEVVEKTVALRNFDLQSNDIQVDLELEEDLPLIQGNFVRLQQVFLNIIINAEHAIGSTGRPGRVRIKASRSTDGDGLVSISNNGPPIPPEMLGNIFDPFFTTKDVGKGTGLGLSTSYGIVKEHGGEINVLSDKEWTTFTVTLPAAREIETAAAAVQSGMHQQELGVSGDSILVLDDEPIILRLLEDFLERKGFAVVTAATGSEALRKLTQPDIMVVVSDINMPEMDGRRLYDEIQKRRPELLDRILFITGDTLDERTADFLKNTGTACLKKPFSFQEITSAIARMTTAHLPAHEADTA
jgi:PAS domain S-box-containing protein